MPSEEAVENFARVKRDFSKFQSGNSTTAKVAAPTHAQDDSVEREDWNKNTKPQMLSNLANNNANSHRSRISRGNHAYVHELWCSPTQARLEYDQDNIDNLVADFIDESIGQMNPIVVCEKINPENPNQHLNVVSGHNRYLAWKSIYDDPANAELIKDKAWIDKHRPKVILDDDHNEFDRLVRQVRENVVRDNLSSWEVCISASRLIEISRKEGRKPLAAVNALKDLLGVKKNLKKYAAVCNIIIDNGILGDHDFIKAFAKYKIESPRPAIAFFNVYKHAVDKKVVSSLMQWVSYVENKGFLQTVSLSDLQIAHFLAELFDDYIPTTDEAVGSPALQARRAQQKQESQQQPVVAIEPLVFTAATSPVEPYVATTQSSVIGGESISTVEPEKPSQPFTHKAQEPFVEHHPATNPQQVAASASVNASIESNTTREEKAETEDVAAFDGDSLFALMRDGSKTEIAEHFRKLINDSDSMEVGLFLELLYSKLGDDFIEATKAHFY